MKRIALWVILIVLTLIANYLVFQYAFSYEFMLRNFKSSEHYKALSKYAPAWDVPIWVGEFAFVAPHAQKQPVALPAIVFMQLYGTKYTAEESMIRIMEHENWSWSHWEFEKVAFSDERENEIFSKYMKGSWKPEDPIPRLVARGGQIQTEDGRVVTLKGENLPLKGLALYSNLEANEETFKKLSDMGANSVRIIVYMDELMPEKGKWDQEAFDTLEHALDLAEKYHMYVILELHKYQCNGFPLWYRQRSSNLGSDCGKFNQMWLNKQPPFEDSWEFMAEGWRRIINVSGGRNIVAGYDLLNEPGTGYELYGYLSAKIEPLDPGKIHFAETMHLFGGMNGDDKPEIYDLVLSPHFYDVWYNSHGLCVISSLASLFLIFIFLILIVYDGYRYMVKKRKS